MTEDAARAIARFVAGSRFADVPTRVVGRTQWHVLDALGAGLAGSDAPGVRELRALARRWGGTPESQIWGADFGVPAPIAALVNGAAARALELDSVHEVGLLHAVVSALPAALAAAEARGAVPGSELLMAVLVGSEIICRVGLAPAVGSCVSGMSFTYQGGVFGAAAAAARALGLDEEATLGALGLAYNMASGNQQALYEGSMSVRVQQGIATQAGVLAALMASSGLAGPRDVFEGRFGYFPVYHQGRYDRQSLLKNLGQQFEIMNMSLKPYPCCRFIHPAIDATLEILSRRKIAPDEISSVRVRVDNVNHYNVVCEPLQEKQSPSSVAEVQFALPFVIATVLVRGRLTLADLTPQGISEMAVRRLAGRVVPEISEEARREQGRSGYPPGQVEVRLRSGEVLKAEVPITKGHPARFMSEVELIAKFRDCAEAGGVQRSVQDAIVNCVWGLTTIGDVKALSALLARPPSEWCYTP